MTHANVIALQCVFDILEDGSYLPVSGRLGWTFDDSYCLLACDPSS